MYGMMALKWQSHIYQGPELQCLLEVKEDLSIDISTCYIILNKLPGSMGYLWSKISSWSSGKNETFIFKSV